MGEAKKVKADEAMPAHKREVLGGDTDNKRIDAREAELKSKVKALVDAQFGGDFRAAFAHYDGDADGAINKVELEQLLSDAKVGNGLTRGMWAGGVIEKMDSGGDAKISWDEFQSSIAGG